MHLDPDGADRLASSVRSTGDQFADLAKHLGAVWVHRLLPAADEVQRLAKEGRILWEDGSEAELRSVAAPALSFDCATRVVELVNERVDKGEETDHALADVLGPQYWAELKEQAEDAHRWHAEVAEFSRRQIAVTAFVALDALVERFLALIRGKLSPQVTSSWRDRRELAAPIARFMGVHDIDELDLPGDGMATAVRLIANDVKHHGARYCRSAALFSKASGTTMSFDAGEIAASASELARYFEAFSEAVASRCWSITETA